MKDLAETSGQSVDLDALLGVAADAAPTAMVVIDDKGTVLFANHQAKRHFGFEEQRLAGLPVESLVPAITTRAAYQEAFLDRPHNRSSGSLDGPLWGRRRDGSEFPLEVALTAVRVDWHTLILASIVDLTERHAVETAARHRRDERAAFQTMVGDIIAAFVNLPQEALDEAITESLRKIVEALALDRAVVWLRDDEGDDFHPAQRWARPSVAVTSERLSVRADFPWHWEKLMNGEIASYSRLSDIPDEVTRGTVSRLGATSGATIGFSIEGRLAGCIAVASVAEERAWSEAELSRLQLVAGVFASAIARQRADNALTAALAEVRRLTERLKAENTYLRSEVRQVLGPSAIIGQSPPLLEALDLVAQVAPTDSSVLLLGETGTGKELFASQLHEGSARHERLMVRVNCAAIPDTLLESELFGREKGAYTGALTRQTGRFELADKSTIFLDEIGDLPMEVQVKLLRVLEDKRVERLGSSRSVRVDVRIIAATHRNLEEMVAAGRFREDLYYRLNVFPIRVPPLRERPGDIPLLILRFVDEFAMRFGKVITGIDSASLDELQRHPWPGNVRELRNVVERAMIVAKSGTRLVIPLTPAVLSTQMPKSAKLVDVEVAHMRQVLEACGWRIRGAGGASERLGLKPSTLETRMAKLGIRRPRRGE